MATGTLTIDLAAIAENWRAVDRLSVGHVQTAAVVKANAYGLGAEQVAAFLARTGARSLFTASATEGAAVRRAVGAAPHIYVFAGHAEGKTQLLRDNALIPLLNSPEQAARHQTALPDAPFGIQLDTGMNRLGMEPGDFAPLRDRLMAAKPALIMSHLACADEPVHPQHHLVPGRLGRQQRQQGPEPLGHLECPAHPAVL